MRLLSLPHTDLHVSALCLGLAEIGVRTTEAEGFALLDAFRAAGGNFVDTARIYSDWVPGEVQRSERILGDYLAACGERDAWVVATKGCHMEQGAPHVQRVSPRCLRIDLEQSLRALRIDCIDLYYLHRDDPTVPLEPVIDTLQDCVRQGLIRAYGCSNWCADRMRAAQAYARASGATGFAANQALWSLGSRHMRPLPDLTLVAWDDQMAELHRAEPILAVPYSSQATGFFSKLLGEVPGVEPRGLEASPYHTPGNLRLAAALYALSRASGLPVSTLVLAYLLEQDFPVAPVIGPKSPAQLESSLRAVEAPLAPEVHRRLLAADASAT
jgi:aryl-alcohol dehydrogenase-like predicted oxidoreductase